MSVTGTEVIARVESMIPNNSKFTAAQKLAALNAAIGDSFPAMKNVKVNSATAIVSGTEEYTPAVTDLTEHGYAAAYVTDATYAKILLRHVTQRQNGTTWTVVLSRGEDLSCAGETLHLQYIARYPELAALTVSSDLPLDYLWKATCLNLCMIALNLANQTDSKPWEILVSQYEKRVNESKINNRSGDIQHMIKNVTETGQPGSTNYDDYRVPLGM